MRLSAARSCPSTAAISTLAAGCNSAPATAVAPAPAPSTGPAVTAPIAALKPYPGAATLITDDERRGRIEKARRLMTEQGLGAIVLEPGTSMSYFVDVRWGLSERPFLRGHSRQGRAGLRLARLRGAARAGDHQVHQRRARLAGGRGLGRGRRRHPEGSRRRDRQGRRSKNGCGSSSPTAFAPRRRRAQFVLATPVTAGCRMFKSPAEIALMQRANDITIEAYKASFADAHRGHDPVRLRPQRRARPSRRSARPADRPACSSANTPRSRTAASRRRN